MDILSATIFSPLVGVLLLLLLPGNKTFLLRAVSLIASLLPLAGSIFLLSFFDQKNPNFQFTENLPWISSFNINYHIGLDGISLPLFLLTTVLTLLSIIISFNIEKRLKEYFISFLILETGLLGVFSSLDLFLFYIFWELVLIPMFLIIGIWGGPNKVYASFKFILYTAIGSVLMLIGIIWTFILTHTFDIVQLSACQEIPLNVAKWIWLLFFVGFAVKVPIFPFHTWLPDAHTEAPTAGSVILAGILLKMGTYGLLRVNFSIFPETTMDNSLFLAILGLVNILYGALTAMAQKDLKKMIAYSSVSHMGFVLLGLSALNVIGINGAVFQMIGHGIITGSLFMLVGVIYDRAHHRQISGFGGIANVVPNYTAVMGISALASIGLPGLAGFVGELLCFLGAFSSFSKITAAACFGILIGAIYTLNMYKDVFFGHLNEKYAGLSDLSIREWIALIPLMVFILLFGLWPQLILNITDPAVQVFLKFF
ncbi:MAG: NADH-quinone oxidoreductase subunit M [bacterium]|nr:NADH-quinone oxidoreductase subunit M [bacterium]